MPSIITLEGARRRKSKTKSSGLGTPSIGTTKCTYNPRTKRWAKLRYVGRGASRSGWTFVKDPDGSCSRGK